MNGHGLKGHGANRYLKLYKGQMATYEDLTKEELINDLIKLSQRIHELEKIKDQHADIPREDYSSDLAHLR